MKRPIANIMCVVVLGGEGNLENLSFSGNILLLQDYVFALLGAHSVNGT